MSEDGSGVLSHTLLLLLLPHCSCSERCCHWTNDYLDPRKTLPNSPPSPFPRTTRICQGVTQVVSTAWLVRPLMTMPVTRRATLTTMQGTRARRPSPTLRTGSTSAPTPWMTGGSTTHPRVSFFFFFLLRWSPAPGLISIISYLPLAFPDHNLTSASRAGGDPISSHHGTTRQHDSPSDPAGDDGREREHSNETTDAGHKKRGLSAFFSLKRDHAHPPQSQPGAPHGSLGHGETEKSHEPAGKTRLFYAIAGGDKRKHEKEVKRREKREEVSQTI